MSGKHAARSRWDPAYDTAQFLAEVAVNQVLEQYGHRPTHIGDVSTAMIFAIESAAEVVEHVNTRSR